MVFCECFCFFSFQSFTYPRIPTCQICRDRYCDTFLNCGHIYCATFAAANWKKGVRYAPFAGVSSKCQKTVLLNKTMFLGTDLWRGSSWVRLINQWKPRCVFYTTVTKLILCSFNQYLMKSIKKYPRRVTLMMLWCFFIILEIRVYSLEHKVFLLLISLLSCW